MIRVITILALLFIRTPLFALDTLDLEHGVRIIFYVKGNGPTPKNGDWVAQKFILKSSKGAKLDQSLPQGFRVKLGANQLPKQWESALFFIPQGSKALIEIPRKLANDFVYFVNNPSDSSNLIIQTDFFAIGEAPVIVPFDTTGKKVVNTRSGLKIFKVLDTDTGEETYYKQFVKVHYTGYLLDGTIFDSSVERGEPFSFELGSDNIILGWNEAIKTMTVGDKIRVIIPPKMAYGKSASGKIPPNSTLIFDIELISISKY